MASGSAERGRLSADMGEVFALFRAGHWNREAIAALTADAVAAIIGHHGRELHKAMQPVLLGII